MRVLILFLFVAFTGCTHPISKNLRASLDPTVSIPVLFASPDSYIGKKVMMGGNIVETRNSPENTEIEVVQKPVDSFGNLDEGDMTTGRFIFRRPGYLEPEIYKNGRDVIGAGVIVGVLTGKIGERDYLFPIIEPEELSLLPEYPDPPRYPYYYDPFYPYSYGFGFRHHHPHRYYYRHRYW
jgi:outer membrane lipoprotein